MPRRPIRLRRAIALAAAAGGGVIDVGYLRLISDHQTGIDARVAFFAGFIALMSVLALAGALLSQRDAPASQVALLGSASGFLAAGVVADFSIGASLVLVGIVALFAVGPRRVSRARLVVSIAASIALLALGLVLTFSTTAAV